MGGVFQFGVRAERPPTIFADTFTVTFHCIFYAVIFSFATFPVTFRRLRGKILESFICILK